MKYIMEYPGLCKFCQSLIAQAASIICEESDDYASDEEGPLMWAGDHRLLCGGYECVSGSDAQKRELDAIHQRALVLATNAVNVVNVVCLTKQLSLWTTFTDNGRYAITIIDGKEVVLIDAETGYVHPYLI